MAEAKSQIASQEDFRPDNIELLYLKIHSHRIDYHINNSIMVGWVVNKSLPHDFCNTMYFSLHSQKGQLRM